MKSEMKTEAPPSPAAEPAPQTNLDSRPWNTANLPSRIGTDLVAAGCAGALVAPVISTIDRSIMENASGANTLSASLRQSAKSFLLRPQSILFSRPTALIFLLYTGTYLTANTLDTASSTVSGRPAATVTSGPGKFAASSAANVGLCMYKDQVFVRMFGPPGVTPRPVPLPCYALFTLRDCMTIFASFNVPPLLAPYIDSKLSDEMKKRFSGQTTAQFLAPAAVQLFSTPTHLLGLDLYNRPGTAAVLSWRDRFETIRSNWLISSAARICRVVPAFGVGGVVNFKVRNNLMQGL